MENSLSTMSLDTLVNKLIDLSVSFGSKLLVALLVFFIGRWIVKKLNRLVINILTKRHVEASLATFTKSLVSITLNFTLVIIIISVLGIETSSFIALFASAGVAVGMALSGTLQNFAGGVMILLFKPFKVGVQCGERILEYRDFSGLLVRCIERSGSGPEVWICA